MRGATACPKRSHGVDGFNSRPSCEGRPFEAEFETAQTFQFTPLVRGATNIRFNISPLKVSIHAPRARGDGIASGASRRKTFQFTPLVRGATVIIQQPLSTQSFNSRPSCEGRHIYREIITPLLVSIHAPRARGDKDTVKRRVLFYVSIHAPRARGDIVWSSISSPGRFNSRPSCEGRRAAAGAFTEGQVSIHAPRARGDGRQVF